MNLDGVAAVIIGGASGLGAATAKALAAAGAKVALFDLNLEKGQAHSGTIGGLFCHTDITDNESIEAGFAMARDIHGQERVLINCAGIGHVSKTVSRNRETGAAVHFPLEAFTRVLDVNLIGTVRCITKSATGMLSLEPTSSGERGVIVNTASVAAEDGQMGQAAYAASKAGIVGMTLPIARDLASEGIRVNTILPGIFATPMMLGAPERVRETLAASVPFPRRLGNPGDYASLALELCRNPYVNGEDIRLDGAIRMGPR